MDQTMSNEYSLYIPRVALSSSGSSNKSTRTIYFKESALKRLSNNGEISETSGESESEGIYGSSTQSNGGFRPNRNRMYNVHNAPKRGSQSSESSSTSNCSSNSLLLSVRNLENFNKSSKISPVIYENQDIFEPNSNHKRQLLANIRTILAIDDISLTNAIEKPKEKEIDAISTTSSMTNTNFTVVTFNDFSRKVTKSKAICRRSHQVTILILVMSFLFLVGISGLVCMLEMRYQKMPR